MSLLERLYRHANGQPGRVALDWSAGQLSYAKLLTQVAAATGLLRASGVEVLALDLDNGPAWVVLDIAALHLGVTLIPLPSFFSAAQARHVIDVSGVQAVISDDPLGLRERLGDRLTADQTPLHLAGTSPAMLTTRYGVSGRARRVPAGVHKITFTSGTTGEPKGVMLQWSQISPVVRSLAAAVDMRAEDRHLALLPLTVLLENVGGVYVSLWAGATVLLRPLRQVGLSGSSALDRRAMVEALTETAATTAIFTPHTLRGLVEAVEGGFDRPLGLRFAAVGGAPVSPRLLERAAAAGLPVFEGYGLSECCSVVCLNTPADHRPGSVGKALPHVRLRITDDGEVVVAGQGFSGYLGSPPGLAAEHHTGDLGEIDADGFLYLHGRRRDVFITAFGRNVAPEWVERELTLEPAIAQAAVFGEARPYNVAVIVPGSGAAAADIEVALARVNRVLPDYARVARWIFATDPFTPTNGLLTGTARIRRDAVMARYVHAIDSLYREVYAS